MKKRLLMLSMGVVMLCAACASWNLTAIHDDPRAELLLAREAFTSMVLVLTDLRVDGAFNDREVERIGVIVAGLSAYLDEWQVDVLAGRPRPGAWDNFNSILNQLSGYYDRGAK